MTNPFGNLIQSAPDAPEPLRESASLLHGRIVLLVTNHFKEMARAHPIDDCKNVAGSAIISALAELTLGFGIDPDYISELYRLQLEKIEGKVRIFGS